MLTQVDNIAQAYKPGVVPDQQVRSQNRAPHQGRTPSPQALIKNGSVIVADAACHLMRSLSACAISVIASRHRSLSFQHSLLIRIRRQGFVKISLIKLCTNSEILHRKSRLLRFFGQSADPSCGNMG